MELKNYQSRVLASLRDYFRLASTSADPDLAFYRVTRENFGQGIPYRPAPGLPGLPYICLRLPTGGGKTLLACHGVGIAAREFCRVDKPLVLWLTPSNAIRSQTLQALSDRTHPYRAALEETFANVTILDIEEALTVNRGTLDSGPTVVVSTMQALRVSDTEGRKVYEVNGQLMSHFDGLPAEIVRELESEDGRVAYSLCNVLRAHRPIIVVDEAHNARTALSFETLARFQPACILEFTATPAREENPSNVLHSVSAAELKAEGMLKLPIRLEAKTNWKDLLSDALGLRSQLEKAARVERERTGEYIRPILLIQAQPARTGSEGVTVDVIQATLGSDHRIPEVEIAVATSAEHGLDGVNLLDPRCEIRYVITIQALKEGWDCPFAYALYSAAELRSSTAVEQILGRVVRLPRASVKTLPELNMAYAFSTSSSFTEAAGALADALVENGFNPQEASEFTTALTAPSPALRAPASGTGVPIERFLGVSSMRLTAAPDLTKASPDLAARLRFSPESGAIEYDGVMGGDHRDQLLSLVSTNEDRTAIEGLFRKTRGLPFDLSGPPSERGIGFEVPVLSIRQAAVTEWLEESHFVEGPWQLSIESPTISETDYPREALAGETGEITLNEAGRVVYRFVRNLQTQMTLIAAERGWTVAKLANWIDQSIDHPDVTAEESGIWLVRAIQGLIDQRGLTLDELVHDKYRLRTAIDLRIKGLRSARKKSGFQALLGTQADSPVVVDPKVVFKFSPSDYPCSTVFTGSYEFKKHYYRKVGSLNDEELACAQFLDNRDEVNFWVRNLDRRPEMAFWLPTSTDRFYPDFVASLKDGRSLVVEYKGEDRWSTDDAKEKRNIGAIWEERSRGRCLFVMPQGPDFAAIVEKLKSP